MDRTELNDLSQWFSGYCRSFSLSDPADQRNLDLKEHHTLNVVGNMAELSRSLGMTGRDAALAEAIGLFHDVGRFPQYARYKTFRDSSSVNHASLGAAVLLEQNVLARLPQPEQQLIVKAVTLHNVFSLPEGLDEETLRSARMIRDADKLDIWRVFSEFYGLPPADRPSAVALGLLDTDETSPEVLASVLRGEMVKLTALRTLNDFKMLQLAWIFDLNFERSVELVLERSYIESLSRTLPQTEAVRKAVDAVRRYVDARLRRS